MSNASANLLLTSLEPARSNTAANTHLRAVAEGFRKRGYVVQTVWRQEGRRLRGLPHFVGAVLRHAPKSSAIYARWHPLDVLSPMTSRLFSKPLVWEVNGLADDLLTNRPRLRTIAPLIHACSRLTLKQGTFAICVSSGLSQVVSRATKQRVPVGVVTNGANVPVDTQTTRSEDAAGHARTTPATSNSSSYVLYFGELANRQGLLELLNARHSVKWPDSVDLLVAGDGHLKALVEQHASEGCLSYLGRLPGPQLTELIEGASASFSLQDTTLYRNTLMGLPLKISESLMAGTPVIASPLSDVPQAVADLPRCTLVDPFSPEDICDAIVTSLRTTERERLEIARVARERFSWEVVLGDTLRLLRQHPRLRAVFA